MPSPDPYQSAIGRLAYASRRDASPEQYAAARAAFTEAKLERHIRDALADALPLSASQRNRLAALLRSGGERS